MGKYVSDLQSDVEIDGSVITGTLNYVTGYTGFSGDAEEQEGNYIVLHAEDSGADRIAVRYTNGAKTLDSDGLVIIRITDTDTPIVYQAFRDDEIVATAWMDISGLTLAEE